MRTRHRLFPTLILFTGLSFALLAFAPTSAFAQQTEKRTAKTVGRAPERTKTRTTVKTSAPASKSGHTPATTIENSNGNTILQTSEGGSLFAPDLGGAIPAEGAGARMMWYPAQKAFRAGRVSLNKDGSQWDAESTGIYSAALGVDTKVSNFGSMAIGEETIASGIDATAMGYQTTASGDLVTTMGNDTGKNTTANAESAMAMGNNTTASGAQPTAMGLDTEASGSNAVAMGTMTEANDNNAVAMGFDSITSPDHSLVTGRCNSAISDALFEVGNGPLNSAGDACDSFSNALTLSENGDLEIAGSLTENSDRRLKTDIQPLGEESLGALREIDPVRFHFKDERTHPDGAQIGLIAREVQKEFPELVSEGDDGMLSLSYTKFSAVLLKGLQEQQLTIDQQEERTAKLKAENEEIKKRVAALEAETTTPAAASLLGSWGLALLLGIGGLVGGALWRRRS